MKCQVPGCDAQVFNGHHCANGHVMVRDACIWPHEVDSPICVYDRESYDKYASGEYKLPKRCICGAELTYVGHVCVALVEQGEMTGEMIVQVEVPLRHVTLNLSDDVKVDDALATQERPWWAGKDVVGMLLRRGWEFAPDGMLKKGPGMLSNLHIPAKDIIECHEVPEVGADRLESEAKGRSRP